MPVKLILFVVSLLSILSVGASPEAEIAAKVLRAKAILDAWQAKDPVRA